MLNFCIVGTGLMGTRHAQNISENRRSNLYSVVDINLQAAKYVAEKYGAKIAPDIYSALDDKHVDVVMITSPASSHCELAISAARAGKAIFCEKPLAEDIRDAEKALKEISKAGVPSWMGFMKRFEPSHYALIRAVNSGEIGEIHMIVITNRDPKLTLLDLMRENHESAPYSLLRESTVHDFDLVRSLLLEEPTQVYVEASSMVDEKVKALDEIDSAMLILKTHSGTLIHINNYYGACYGYDQRIEVVGSKGMLRTENGPTTNLVKYSHDGSKHDRLFSGPPNMELFFQHKYEKAYIKELDLFIDAIESGQKPLVTVEDGYKAQVMVEASVESLKTGTVVKFNL